MPLWTIYHPPQAFTSPETKRALAKAITSTYVAGNLPAFYVNVFFQVLQPDDLYVGGVPRPSPHTAENEPGPKSDAPFIRITIQNIARKITTDEMRDRFLARIDKELKPFIADQGYDWEYSVLETSRDLWKIQGMVPPMPGTEAEKLWFTENRAVEFEGKDGGFEGKL